MKKIRLSFLLTLFVYLHSSACLNYYYSLDKEGNLIPIGLNWHDPFNINFNKEKEVKQLKKLEEKLKTEKNYMLLSDYSVGLMKLGKHEEALSILSVLYQLHPEEYQLASNLGTAYELNGMIDSALKYIRRGIELNPNDHEGSEWIHAKILEAKFNLRIDPNHLHKNSLLGLSVQQKKDSLVLQQINIQLKERVPFTPPPDLIMSLLFTDLGDISANIRSIEYAKAYYQIARDYYGGDSVLLTPKIKQMIKLIGAYTNVRPKDKKTQVGTDMKLGFFKYQELLIDNDKKKFQVNWKIVQTNPDSLLAMANISKPLPLPVDSISHQQNPVVDHSKQERIEHSCTNWFVYGAMALVLLTAFIFAFIKMRK